MKTFSVLLVFACLAVALMLVGNTADAEPFEFRIQGTRGVAIVETAARQVTFQLIDLANGEGIPNIPVDFEAVGVAISAYNGVPAAGSTQANTDADGSIEVSLTVDPDAPSPYLQATPNPRTTYAVDATAYFRATPVPDPPIKLVVLPPQETATPAAPNLDPTYVNPDWVDYGSVAERRLTSLDPIHLADGPRNTRAATAQAYQESVGNLFTTVIEIREVKDLSAWQMDIAFNPQILRALAVKPGQFLAQGDYVPFFNSGVIDNDRGVIKGISQARVGRIANQTPPPANSLASPSPPGVSTSDRQAAGILLCIDFQVLEFAEESLGLNNVQLSNSKGERISYYATINPIVVTHRFPAEDVNRDRVVGIQDLIVVAGSLGEANPINPRADVNDDGIVNALDLIQVSSHDSWAKAVAPKLVREPNKFQGPEGPAAPVMVKDSADITPGMIQVWIDIARVEDDGSAIFDLGIANLERLLQTTVPEETKLLLNYPNPFNPETWIPYQLAEATDVTVSIYSVNGALVRTLALGHQAAGVYQTKSQAAYWDGRNELGERVASGVYFYTRTAGDFSATGKMLVRK